MALELEQVSKRYGRRGPLVLRDVSASIPAGGFTAALAVPLAVLLAAATAAGLVSLASARRC